MIYKARVIDNSMFAKTGQIRVRIFEKTHSLHANDDLSEYPETISQFAEKTITIFGEEKEIINDQMAYVSTPFGGGENYGMFWLPQINSVGIVADFGNTNSVKNNGNYIWLGGVFEYTPRRIIENKNKEKIVLQSNVNVPSLDNYSNGINNDEISKEIKNSFIIKTKTTEMPEEKKVIEERHKLSFSKSKVKNTFIMNDECIQLLHGENSKLHISDDLIELSSSGKNNNSIFSINEKGYLDIRTKIDNDDAEKEISISSNEENKLILKIEGQEKGKNIYTNLTLGSEEIVLENGTDKNKATIKIEGSNISVYSDGVVNISASRVNLGNGAEHKVLTLNGKAPEGTVASETVYA